MSAETEKVVAILRSYLGVFDDAIDSLSNARESLIAQLARVGVSSIPPPDEDTK